MGIGDPTATWWSAGAAIAIDVAFKATLIYLVTMLVSRTMARRCPLCCATLWHTCLIALILLPIACIALPRWRINLLPDIPVAVVSPSASNAAQDLTTSATTPLMNMATWYERAVNVPLKKINGSTSKAAHRSMNWWLYGAIVYLMVSGVLATRLIGSLVNIERTRRKSAPIEDRVWQKSLATWRRRLGIKRPVGIALTDQINVPVIIGWRRSNILIPRSVFARNGSHRDSVLLHELCHVKRCDYAWHLLLRIVQIIYWFHPMIWIIGQTIARIRERTCDDVCVHHLQDRHQYRLALLAFASTTRTAATGLTRIGHGTFVQNRPAPRLDRSHHGERPLCCTVARTHRGRRPRHCPHDRGRCCAV